MLIPQPQIRQEIAVKALLQERLFGKGGVQGLDGEAHRHRKQLFLSLVSPEQVERLAQISAADWQERARRWEREEHVELYAEARENLTRAVCAWAGVPLEEEEFDQRVRELTALFEHAGAIGPRHWWSRLARKRAERWAAGLIRAVRQGTLTPPAGSALQVIATYTELDGRLLPPRIAAVELLNILRPTVAVAVFITLAALALHHYPRCRDKLRADDGTYAEAFAQEVRRFYPFFPAAAARIRRDFEWQGLSFPKGARALLDLHGTNHDERLWDAPEEFRPERFLKERPSPFAFIPQGGGDPAQHHRCPGEGIAVVLIQAAIRFLNNDIAYEVPEQDLTLGDSSLPALPHSRLVIANVRPRARLH